MQILKLNYWKCIMNYVKVRWLWGKKKEKKKAFVAAYNKPRLSTHSSQVKAATGFPPRFSGFSWAREWCWVVMLEGQPLLDVSVPSSGLSQGSTGQFLHLLPPTYWALCPLSGLLHMNSMQFYVVHLLPLLLFSCLSTNWDRIRLQGMSYNCEGPVTASTHWSMALGAKQRCCWFFFLKLSIPNAEPSLLLYGAEGQ